MIYSACDYDVIVLIVFDASQYYRHLSNQGDERGKTGEPFLSLALF